MPAKDTVTLTVFAAVGMTANVCPLTAVTGEHWTMAVVDGTPVHVLLTMYVVVQAVLAIEHVPIDAMTPPAVPNFTVPATSNVAPGLVVPMPTFGTMEFLNFDELFPNFSESLIF